MKSCPHAPRTRQTFSAIFLACLLASTTCPVLAMVKPAAAKPAPLAVGPTCPTATFTMSYS